MLSKLNKLNQEFEIKSIFDNSFKKYGQVLNNKLFEEAFSYLETLSIPEEGNFYIAHDENFLKNLSDIKGYQDVFGFMNLEFGYVNGNNRYLNALEYHKSSEINVCVSDMVLFIGDYKDIINNTYDSTQCEVYFVPRHTVIELYAGTLHFSPCKVHDDGFKCGVILPFGTNQDFVQSHFDFQQDNHLLFKTNKWLLAHYQNENLKEKGAYPGLTGVNYKIKY